MITLLGCIQEGGKKAWNLREKGKAECVIKYKGEKEGKRKRKSSETEKYEIPGRAWAAG